MDRTERLQRRLTIAVTEAADADRVWRKALDRVVPPGDEAAAVVAARRLHAVWQERERARARVADLQRLLAERGHRERSTRLRQTASFLVWHMRGRTDRQQVVR